jgi:hypothetical protein
MLRPFALVLLVVSGCGDEIAVGPAIFCWDRDGSSTCDPDEDVDLSGACDVDDCQGATGPAGPTGATGATGSAGASGADGVEGPAGPAGPQGEPGAAGAPGDPGPEGPMGPIGPMGPQGPIGPAGANGAEGAQGPQGPQGDAGAQGPQGDPGTAGAPGDPGAPGADGIDGVACWDLDGDGACNPIAEDTDGDFLCTVNDCTGPRGPAGPIGQDGPAGPQGPQGPDGPAGPAGPAGQDGSPDTPAEVLAKLLGVDGPGSGISADFLDGIDSATLLGRFASIEARLDAQEELVSVLGATAFTSDGAVSYGGDVGLVAVKQLCIDEFGAGARACSYTDLSDAIANGDITPTNVTVWLPRDAGADVGACRGMTDAGASGLVLSIDATGVLDAVAVESCGGTHPFLCCRGHR